MAVLSESVRGNAKANTRMGMVEVTLRVLDTPRVTVAE